MDPEKNLELFLIKVSVFIFRPIQSTIFKFFFWLYCLLRVAFIKGEMDLVLERKKDFDSIEDLNGLVEYFTNKYKYEPDPPLFDHDNSKLEFFLRNGDCDDMAQFACRKLKEIGISATRVYMAATGSPSHMDCYFEINGGCFLFNYGRIVAGENFDDCIMKLSLVYYIEKNYFKYPF